MKRHTRFKLLIPAGLLGLAISFLVRAQFPSLDFLPWVEATQWGLLRQYLPRKSSPHKVIVMFLDDVDTQVRLGPLPWSIDKYSELLERLSERGVSSLAFDFIIQSTEDTSTA